MSFQFPKTVHQWRSQVTKFSLHNSSSQNVKCESGSKIAYEQFLLLRTLWNARLDAEEFDKHCEIEGWITPRILKKAKSSLEGLQSWKHYEESFLPPFNAATGRGTAQGSFALVR
ncbi:hypothetical protein J3458_020952 [Metarhizium acridum]|nr:hypothetical protein J3458_020952 [Metarhizium acridum]